MAPSPPLVLGRGRFFTLITMALQKKKKKKTLPIGTLIMKLGLLQHIHAKNSNSKN